MTEYSPEPGGEIPETESTPLSSVPPSGVGNHPAPGYAAPGYPAPGYAAPGNPAPGYPAPEYGPPPGFGPPPDYVPPPGYGTPPGYGPPPGYGAPPGVYAGQAFYPPPPPAKPLGWLIATWILFWPLAIYSMVSAWSEIDRAAWYGNYAEVERQCARVRKFGIIAVCITGVMFLLWLVFVIVIISVAASNCQPNSC